MQEAHFFVHDLFGNLLLGYHSFNGHHTLFQAEKFIAADGLCVNGYNFFTLPGNYVYSMIKAS